VRLNVRTDAGKLIIVTSRTSDAAGTYQGLLVLASNPYGVRLIDDDSRFAIERF
jgi:hypothetical protein